jgi:hypothetical protein
MPGFNLSSVHLIFVLEKVALGEGFLRVLWFFPCYYQCIREGQKDKLATPENVLKTQYPFRNREASDRKEFVFEKLQNLVAHHCVPLHRSHFLGQ